MATFSVNPHRLDPYGNFKFRVILDGQPVPAVIRVSPLRRRTETILYRDGTFPSYRMNSPGLTSFEPLTIERGLTHDTTFEDWASMTYNPSGDGGMSLRDFRKDLRIELLNQQGAVVLSYMVYRAWVSEYQALPELDASGKAVAVEAVVLQYEGFDRDRAVMEPQET